MGGPGAGKGTQCSLLKRDFKIEHLSISGMLREEMERPGSPYVDEINENMVLGRVGRPELTVKLLRKRIDEAVEAGIHHVILDSGLCLQRYHRYSWFHRLPSEHSTERSLYSGD